MSVESDMKDEDDEQRSYFRVDDIISVVANPVNIDNGKRDHILKSLVSSKAFSLMDAPGLSQTGEEPRPPASEGETKVYNMISEIKTKLDFIINHFILKEEGLLTPEKKFVNISASGVRFTIDHPVKLNDVMEIKMILPTYPPVAVFAYGEVKRVIDLGNNEFEIALEYLNMGESVKNEIIQYTLSHQRETIRQVKEQN